MLTTITQKGQTVVPAEIRKKFSIEANTYLDWVVEGNTIKVFPLTQSTLEKSYGFFANKASLNENLMKGRKKDRERERKKTSK